ncbi:biotin--[acetyl-CoA-carboxylase] ligase [Bacteroidales bacterium]|nr:biotin--[acetyl-CoA-carboxylase] ligase [Bacteroidales bacterium]
MSDTMPNTMLNIIAYRSLGSTNLQLKELAAQKELLSGTCLTTEEQWAGRGQRGSSWESETGKNLIFSVYYKLDLPIEWNFYLVEVAALSIKKVLDNYCKFISIKWPNDIYYKDKKIAGILIENDLQGKKISSSIMGIGLNVNQTSFISDAPNPISLIQILNKEINRQDILEKILKEMNLLVQQILTNKLNIHEQYNACLYRKNELRPYRDDGGEFLAEILEVDTEGFLHLKTDKNELRKYTFKEVKYLVL